MSLREFVADLLHGRHTTHSCVGGEWNTTSKRLQELRSAIVDDTEFLNRAMREYRESSWDDRDFRELPADVQHAILRRAQDMKEHVPRARVA